MATAGGPGLNFLRVNAAIPGFLRPAAGSRGERRLGEAADAYVLGLELRPELFQVRNALGEVYCDLGRTDDAEKCFRSVLDRT